jgi:nucleoside-diphosphate-sugar epimerase
MTSKVSGKNILLIGGAGFIGHNLALELKKRGAEVSILDSLQVNNFLTYITHKEGLTNQDLYLKIINERLQLLRDSGIPLQIQDCRDYHATWRWMVDVLKPQVVVHLAAVAHAGKSNKDPFSTFDHSFRTLENALDCSRGRVEHFIYLSSSMVYGQFAEGCVNEETQCEPLGIYGALKFGGEKLVIAYKQVFDLPYTIVRPSALYGERCVSRRVGQIFIENAIQGLDIKINGNGDSRLDFTYIDDFVQGIIRVIENENSVNQTFNITYGQGRSLTDMVGILKEHFPKVNVEYLPKDELMPDRGTLSVEKARKLLGYEPQWPLERGFARYIDWYKKLFGDACVSKGSLSLLY